MSIAEASGDWALLLEAVRHEARRNRAVSDGPSTHAVLDPEATGNVDLSK